MFIIQSDLRPGGIQNALRDLMRPGLEEVRICSAYVSLSGVRLLFEDISRVARGGQLRNVRKELVTSFDFGLTDPAALRVWRDSENSEVSVVGQAVLNLPRLNPQVAYHPKLYIFTREDHTVGTLVGSANLTGRGLTVNNEAAWFERRHEDPAVVERAWESATQAAVPLAADLLNEYELQRRRPENRPPRDVDRGLPTPRLGQLRHFAPFVEAEVHLGEFSQMWVQSTGMQGGAQNQLELPRGSHQFFGAVFRDYDAQGVQRIVSPNLVSGRSEWTDRWVTWHPHNGMERINLPSRSTGGFDYRNSLVLFRRVRRNLYELQVHPWNSDPAKAILAGSLQLGSVFRVGHNSNRLSGFLR